MANVTNLQATSDVHGDIYRRKLETRPVTEFLRELQKNIRNNKKVQALAQIEAISATDKGKELQKYRTEIQGSDDTLSLLQLAANCHTDNDVLLRLANECPSLLLLQRRGDFEGQTVLHTIISKQNDEAVNAILSILKQKKPKQLSILLTTKAIGPRFVATLLMGELPLTVAALTFNMKMVKLLYDYGALPQARNSEGDTMFHSLVRWAALYPEKQESVQNVIRKLHDWLVELRSTSKPNCMYFARSVWFIENERGQTALRLAASLALPSIVNLILNLDGVYCRLDKNDGVFDSLEYDVTEIDPVARRIWREKTAKRLTENRVTPVRALGLPPASKQMLENSFFSSVVPLTVSIRVPTSFETFKLKRTASVLELISETGDMRTAFGLMDNYLMRSIIRKKWFHYRKYYWIWLMLHILWMVLLSTYAIYRARLIPNPSSNVTNDPSDAHKTFVDVTAGLTIGGAICLLLAEVVLYVRSGQPFAFLSVHYNGVYRLLLLLLSLSLLVDGIWYFAGTPDNNYLLILALLIGWWFLTFFMRPWDGISYYTVLLQKVLLGDMIRFCVIIFLELLSFSLCMYVIYIPADGTDSGVFRGFDHTMLTMFKVMMGLTDLEILYEAPRPWLAIVLFVAFVLLTSLLMLNSLIAMMSNTCSLVSEDRVKQGELQRLSVVLMIEGLMPRVLTWNSGTKKVVKYYDYRNEQTSRKTRYFTKIASVVPHGHKAHIPEKQNVGSLDPTASTGGPKTTERQRTTQTETTQVKNRPDDLTETTEMDLQLSNLYVRSLPH